MRLNRLDEVRALLVAGFSGCLVIFGALVALYAAQLVPETGLDGGTNPGPRWLRWLQFAFACGVPVAAGFAVRAALRARRRETPLRRAYTALALSVGAFGGWVLTFFDWWGSDSA